MNKTTIKIDMYDVLQRIKNEALEYAGFDFGYSNRIVARLWNDGDITYDYFDGNFHPINTNDYIEIAESTTFYYINDIISDDLSITESEHISSDYLDYLETENNNELIKEFKELDDIDLEIEFIKEHNLKWYEEWMGEAERNIIDFYDFGESMEERYGEDFDRELKEFEERHDLTIEFI